MRYICDICGQFIAEKDLEEGRAIVRLITPDSSFSMEEYETLCPKCLQKELDKPVY